MLVIFLITLLFTTHGLAAGETGEYLKYQEPQPPASSWLAASGYIVSLVLTFLLVLGLAYFTSRFLAQRINGSTGLNSGKIHATLSLGANRAVYVVEIAGKFMVLGVTEHSISLLKEITALEDIEQLKVPMNNNLPPEQFENVFHRQLNSLKQLNKRFPAAFGSDTRELNEKEHENDIRKR
ncbi:flagellar biosynthetic protein FliO [Sporomusa malonica]|uniref:Flagellar protein n=2 Tax=Sporomusa malonica TaxID=112901 RepID=A0A1W2AYQ5_9FIRM|nr:flagellar protein FliO/FliZ [Sporomusa malonica]